MANRPVSRLSLDPRLCQHLEANNVRTARDVIALSPLDLMELLGLTWSAAHALLQAVSAQVTPPYNTAWEALEQLQSTSASYLHTGMPTLDGALRRGLPCGSITELVGPGGVGKSQMCHMMALRAALPQRLGGLGSGVIYIDTERKFSAVRLAEMARAGAAAAAATHAHLQQQQQHPGHNGDGGAGTEAVEAAAMEAMGDAQLAEVLGRVVILNPGSTAELAGVLESLESYVLQHRAQLVVVDSIAALARTEFGGPPGGAAGAGGAAGGPGGGGGGSIMERQALLGRLASQLKHVAESLQVPVLVTNQVTTRIGDKQQQQQGGPGGSGGGGGGQLTAALGTKWAHCVNVRLVLERVLERRSLRVAKSPSCANVLLEYVIGPAGLQQVDTDPRDGLLQSLLRGRGGNALDLAIRNEIDYGDDGAW